MNLSGETGQFEGKFILIKKFIFYQIYKINIVSFNLFQDKHLNTALT